MASTTTTPLRSGPPAVLASLQDWKLIGSKSRYAELYSARLPTSSSTSELVAVKVSPLLTDERRYFDDHDGDGFAWSIEEQMKEVRVWLDIQRHLSGGGRHRPHGPPELLLLCTAPRHPVDAVANSGRWLNHRLNHHWVPRPDSPVVVVICELLEGDMQSWITRRAHSPNEWLGVLLGGLISLMPIHQLGIYHGDAHDGNLLFSTALANNPADQPVVVAASETKCVVRWTISEHDRIGNVTQTLVFYQPGDKLWRWTDFGFSKYLKMKLERSHAQLWRDVWRFCCTVLHPEVFCTLSTVQRQSLLDALNQVLIEITAQGDASSNSNNDSDASSMTSSTRPVDRYPPAWLMLKQLHSMGVFGLDRIPDECNVLIGDFKLHVRPI